jgi:hypothetical protein
MLFLWVCNLASHPEVRTQNVRWLENGFFRRVFGYDREEKAENWRKLHNELLYFSPNIVRIMK